MGQNANIWPKLTKKAYVEPNLAIYESQILIFLGVNKIFGTLITERTPRQLVCIVFGRAWNEIGQKGRYLAKNASFGPNVAVLGPKIHFWGME